jgi:hypothetical protein
MGRQTLLSIRIGRDRISEVLEPHIGPADALERANNIAQALALGADNPALIARRMLRNQKIEDTPAVADEIGRAWQAGVTAVTA